MPQNYTLYKGGRYRPDPNRFLYNVDTLWYNIEAENYEDNFYELEPYLLEGRQSFNDNEDLKTLDIIIPPNDGYTSFEIQGGQPPAYSYSIRSKDLAVYFAKSKRENQSPMKVQINQEILWEKGVLEAFSESLQVLIQLGFIIGQAKLNRIDFAVHTDQFMFNLSDFKKFYYPTDFSNKIKPDWYRLDPLTGEFGTMMIGSRKRRQLRIYNKTKEILDHQKYFFNDIYDKHGIDHRNVWNIELELRRPFFKDLDDPECSKICDDMYYALSHDGLAKLWSFAIRDYGFENNAFWTMLLNNNNNQFKYEGISLIRDKTNNWDIKKEIGQIVGRIKKVVLQENDISFNHAFELTYGHALEYIDEKEMDFEQTVLGIKKKYHSDVFRKTIKKGTSFNDAPIQWLDS